MPIWPIKPRVDQNSGAIFRPEAYGTVNGADADIDMPLVQAAIDAAGAAGGTQTVRLDQTYAMLESAAAPASCGKYTDTYYGIWCNYDDLIIDGNGTGTLLLEDAPVHTRYCILLVGDGGYQAGGWPGLATLLATGNICRRVQIKNLTFDGSCLTDGEIAALAGDVFSAPLGLVFCQDFIVDGCTFDVGWGNNGAVGCVATCRNFTVRNCTVTEMWDHGYFADGAKNAVFDNCDVLGQVAAATGNFAITIATSGDYESYSDSCTITNCTIVGTLDGIVISGENGSILNNIVTLKDVNLTRMGILVAPGYSASVNCDAHGEAVVTGNTVTRPPGATWPIGYGVYLNGRNVGFGGNPLEVHDCVITANEFNRVTYGLVLGVQAIDNTFQSNTLNGVTEYADDSGGTATGNTIGPNS